MQPVRILAIDDSEDDQRLYLRALRSTCVVHPATSAAAGLAELRDRQPDLVLLDYNLPDMNGLEVLAHLPQDLAPPVIMLTGEGTEAVAVEAMKRGASDYLVKDFGGRYLQLLPSLIERALAAHARQAAADRVRRLHETILSTVGDGILVLDLDGAISFANPAAERMLRYSAGGLAGRGMGEVLDPADHATGWGDHPIRTACATRTTVRVGDASFRRSTGERLPVEYTASPLERGASETPGIVLAFHDLTERKRAEARLIESAERIAESEHRQALVFSATADGFLDVDVAAGTVFRSPRCSEILGVSPNEAPSKSIVWGRAHRDDQARVADIWRAIQTGRIDRMNVEYRVEAPAGQARWVRLRGAVVDRATGGAPLRVVGAVTDITAEKDAADRLAAEMTRNEALVAELREALINLKTLRGLLPVCAWCKKIRNDSGYWQQIEQYLGEHADVRFSHGLCPECAARYFPDLVTPR